VGWSLIEATDADQHPHLQWLSWHRWLRDQDCADLQPRRWVYLRYAHQIVQAALAGQGLAPPAAGGRGPGRRPAGGGVPAPAAGFPAGLLAADRSAQRQRPEVQAFAQWLQQQAHDTRQAMAPVDDPA
jgi:DNA-binding transcriptional LysR family regulator